MALDPDLVPDPVSRAPFSFDFQVSQGSPPLAHSFPINFPGSQSSPPSLSPVTSSTLSFLCFAVPRSNNYLLQYKRENLVLLKLKWLKVIQA